MILSLIAIAIALGCVVYTFYFIRATKRNMRTVTEAAAKAKATSARITRLWNLNVKTRSEIKAMKHRLNKTLPFPGAEKVNKADNSAD